ncbi:MAG: PEP-CTERM sorting domain-containing protein [Myxococcota bacterium]
MGCGRIGSWIGRAVFALSLSGALGVASPALALSLADLIVQPMSPGEGPIALELADPSMATPLLLGSDYRFSLQRLAPFPTQNNPDPNDPSTWNVLHYEASLTYFGSSSQESGDFLLVLTTLRDGAALLNGGWLRSSLADDGYFVVHDALGGGTIADSEGERFIGLRFPALNGVTQTFRYDVVLRERLDVQLNHFVRGYHTPIQPIPEPGALALAGLGLALVARLRRGRPFSD